VRVSVRVTV